MRPVCRYATIHAAKQSRTAARTTECCRVAQNGTSVFFRAVGDGKLDAVELIVQAGADIDAPGLDGTTRTALLEAMCCGNVQVARYLIENGANLEARDEVRRSAAC